MGKKSEERARRKAQRRAWGFIVEAHFHFVCGDRDHSLYPTEPH